MGMINKDAAVALRDALGFPQDGTALKYVRLRVTGWIGDGLAPVHWPDGDTIAEETATCTDDVTALMWLEDEGTIDEWWRDHELAKWEGPWGAGLPYYLNPDNDDGEDDGDHDPIIVRGDNASALIVAIAAYVQQHAATHAAGSDGGAG